MDLEEIKGLCLGLLMMTVLVLPWKLTLDWMDRESEKRRHGKPFESLTSFL